MRSQWPGPAAHSRSIDQRWTPIVRQDQLLVQKMSKLGLEDTCALCGARLHTLRKKTSPLNGLHDPQNRLSIDVLQREIDKMGFGINRDCMSVRHRERTHQAQLSSVLTKYRDISRLGGDVKQLESGIKSHNRPLRWPTWVTVGPRVIPMPPAASKM